MCAGSRLGSKPATVSRWCTFASVPFNWRCGASLLECARVAMMCRGLTSSGGSQEAGGTFSASTGLWPTAGLCTTIRAVHHDYWRRVREGENANEGKATTELCRWSRPCLASCGKGCSEDCAHVRHAALCVGKRQGCGEEAVRLCHRQPQAMQSYIRFVGIFVGTNIQAIN